MAGWSTVTAAADGDVAVLWLDRPDNGNAFNRLMQAELHAALAELDADERIRAIVVTGRGPIFSAGTQLRADGRSFAMSPAEMAAQWAELKNRPRPWQLRTPVLGAMNGSAVGLGLTLSLQWDIRVMAEGAKYGFVFSRRGVTPEANSLWLLPRLIGLSRATELLLTGRYFTAAEAVAMGLATAAAPAAQVLDRTLELARDIAAHTSPLAVALTKELLYQTLGETDREAAFRHEWELLRWMGNQPDSAEAVQAFLAKRPPRWRSAKSARGPAAGPDEPPS
jgi:enoyl-CoA hydratase/carnithine racemase